MKTIEDKEVDLRVQQVPNWRAFECAQELIKLFEKPTGRRNIKDIKDVLERFDEVGVLESPEKIQEYIDNKCGLSR